MSAITPPLTSPKPYLIRAWHEWMSDNGLTPHILVMVDATVAVPREYVKNNEVVLNVSSEATGSLNLGNEKISFQARFSGRVREIVVPIDRVASIFARENGQGMVFEALLAEDAEFEDLAKDGQASAEPAERPGAPQGLSLVNKGRMADASTQTKLESGEPDGKKSDDESPPPAPKGGGLKVVK